MSYPQEPSASLSHTVHAESGAEGHAYDPDARDPTHTRAHSARQRPRPPRPSLAPICIVLIKSTATDDLEPGVIKWTYDRVNWLGRLGRGDRGSYGGRGASPTLRADAEA